MENKTNTATPKYIQLYLDNETIIQHLTDKQAGKLIRLLFAYANRGEKPCIKGDNILTLVFDVLSRQIDRDFKKYRDKCEKNKASANKRWHADKKESEKSHDGESDDMPAHSNEYCRCQEEDKEEDEEKDENENKEKYEDEEKEEKKEKEKCVIEENKKEEII